MFVALFIHIDFNRTLPVDSNTLVCTAVRSVGRPNEDPTNSRPTAPLAQGLSTHCLRHMQSRQLIPKTYILTPNLPWTPVRENTNLDCSSLRFARSHTSHFCLETLMHSETESAAWEAKGAHTQARKTLISWARLDQTKILFTA